MTTPGAGVVQRLSNAICGFESFAARAHDATLTTTDCAEHARLLRDACIAISEAHVERDMWKKAWGEEDGFGADAMGRLDRVTPRLRISGALYSPSGMLEALDALIARDKAGAEYALELRDLLEQAVSEVAAIETEYGDTGPTRLSLAIRAALAKNPEPDASRSQLRRLAAQKGEPAPDFSDDAVTGHIPQEGE